MCYLGMVGSEGESQTREPDCPRTPRMHTDMALVSSLAIPSADSEHYKRIIAARALLDTIHPSTGLPLWLFIANRLYREHDMGHFVKQRYIQSGSLDVDSYFQLLSSAPFFYTVPALFHDFRQSGLNMSPVSGLVNDEVPNTL